MIDEVGDELNVDTVGIAIVDFSHNVLRELTEVFDPAVFFPDTGEADGLAANILGSNGIFNASPFFNEFFACVELLHPGLPSDSEAREGGEDVDVEVGVIGLIGGDEATNGYAAVVGIVFDADAAAIEQEVFLLKRKAVSHIWCLNIANMHGLQW